MNTSMDALHPVAGGSKDTTNDALYVSDAI